MSGPAKWSLGAEAPAPVGTEKKPVKKTQKPSKPKK